MKLGAKHNHIITLELDDGEVHLLWHALSAATSGAVKPTIFTESFARELGDSLNILLNLGHINLRLPKEFD